MCPDDEGNYYSHQATQERKRQQDFNSKMMRFALDARAGQYAAELAAEKPIDEMNLEETTEALYRRWADVVTELDDCRGVYGETKEAWRRKLDDLSLTDSRSMEEIRELCQRMRDYDDGEQITDGVRLSLARLEDACARYQHLQGRK
jgi:hypothetical protein